MVTIISQLKRGKPLQGQSREIVYNVYKYFVNEANKFKTIKSDDRSIYFNKVQERVVNATGISTKTLNKILNEVDNASPSNIFQFSTPKKGRPRKECSPTAAGASERQRRKRVHSTSSEHDEDEDSAAEENTHYTSDNDKESQKGKLRVSSDILISESRNITLDQELLMDLHALSDKIQNFYPVLAGRQFTLCFKGEDGDKCEYIFTSASDTRRNGERHSSLRCDECKVNIVGSRYKCVSCADYDLCSACEALGIHAHHVMMRITKPLNVKQVREMVQRCCDVMKAGDISALDKSTSGGDNSAVQKNIFDASTSKEAPPVNDTLDKLKRALNPKSKVISSRHVSKPLVVKSVGASKANASRTTDIADDQQKKTNEDRKIKAEASEEKDEIRLTVKVEPDDPDPDDSDQGRYYNSFTHMEPTLAIQDVKIEYPDPLETEPTLTIDEMKIEYPDPIEADASSEIPVNLVQPTSAALPPRSSDNDTDPGGAAGSSGASRSEEETSSVCVTYTHKRIKH